MFGNAKCLINKDKKEHNKYVIGDLEALNDIDFSNQFWTIIIITQFNFFFKLLSHSQQKFLFNKIGLNVKPEDR